jgi:hypothetical protein
MVFVGIPANQPGGTWPTTPNTFVNPTPLSREKPFLWFDGTNYAVFVPSPRTNTNGITWGGGQTPGTSIPISQFYIARAGERGQPEADGGTVERLGTDDHRGPSLDVSLGVLARTAALARLVAAAELELLGEPLLDQVVDGCVE